MTSAGSLEFQQRYFKVVDKPPIDGDTSLARQHCPGDAALLPKMRGYLNQRRFHFCVDGTFRDCAQMRVEALREKIVHAGEVGVERRTPDVCTLCYVFDANVLVAALERQFSKRNSKRGTASSDTPIALTWLQRIPW
jgi:hypothetical protein